MKADEPLKVLHVSPTREDHGGIQSTLRHHHTRDAGLGLQSRFISLFDRTATWPGDCVSLGAGGGMTVGTVRRRFARAVAPPRDETVIYHDGWGIEWFAPLDGAHRRIVYLHTERPHADNLARIFGPRADGFLSVSRSYADRVRQLWPEIESERFCVLPFFVDPPEGFGESAAGGRRGAVWRIGFSGRVERAAKRLDRLPELLAALARRGVDCEVEIVGDGSYLPTLKAQLENDRRVTFRGWLSGEDYWRAVAGWDCIVLLSDYEGFSRAVMEGMIGGVLPIHPSFSDAAAELLGPAAKAGLYPTGDMGAAADRIARLASAPAESIDSLRRAVAAHLAGHTIAAYESAYREFLDRIGRLPARAGAPAPPGWHNLLPLGVYTRLFPSRF